MLERFALTDRIAIVTGAGRGIGKGIALGMAEAGADVVCTARTLSEIEAIAVQVRSLGRRALVVQTDVSEETQTQALVARTLDHFGRVDILVNNAGVVDWTPTLEMNHARFKALMDIHLGGCFNCSRAVAPAMLQQEKGVIVNISSVAGSRGLGQMVHYGAAKAGIVNLTQSLAAEWAPAIRVNCISVGGVLIERTAIGIYGTPEKHDFHASRTLRRRLGSREDIALATIFFASDASDWITGQTLAVDGGQA